MHYGVLPDLLDSMILGTSENPRHTTENTIIQNGLHTKSVGSQWSPVSGLACSPKKASGPSFVYSPVSCLGTVTNISSPEEIIMQEAPPIEPVADPTSLSGSVESSSTVPHEQVVHNPPPNKRRK